MVSLIAVVVIAAMGGGRDEDSRPPGRARTFFRGDLRSADLSADPEVFLVRHRDRDVEVKPGVVSHGRVAVRLYDYETGQLLSSSTVDLAPRATAVDHEMAEAIVASLLGG